MITMTDERWEIDGETDTQTYASCYSSYSTGTEMQLFLGCRPNSYIVIKTWKSTPLLMSVNRNMGWNGITFSINIVGSTTTIYHSHMVNVCFKGNVCFTNGPTIQKQQPSQSVLY